MKITVMLPYVRIAAEVPEHEARYIVQYVLAAAGKVGGPTEASECQDPFEDAPEDEGKPAERNSGG